MIRCVQNDWRYYGESSNISGRLASHKSQLRRQIHTNQSLQVDWTTYGEELFEFIVLYMSDDWSDVQNRRAKETELILFDRARSYNVFDSASRPGEANGFWHRLHTPEAKQKIREALKGRPNDALGRKVCIRGKFYPSIAQASRDTNMARKTIRIKVNDPNEPNFYILDETQEKNLGTV